MPLAPEPLLIGEAPAPKAPGRPLEGRAGLVLARCCREAGVSVPLAEFRKANLFEECPDRWSAFDAREAAWALPLAPVSVLLGRKVAAAYGVAGLPWFHWTQAPGGEWLTVTPHPSGKNLLLNDERTRRRIGFALAEAARLAGC